jgi:uncharacterized protein (TIGR00369 family)
MELNRLHIQELIKLINSAPFFQNLSMVIEDMGIGYSVVKIVLQQKHLSPYAAIQGGVYSSIIDTAAYWAPYSELAEDVGLISMDVNVHNLASITEGVIIARGERIKIGRTICLSHVLVEDKNGKVLAEGSSKLLITKGLQTIPNMTGYSSATMPPKFI